MARVIITLRIRPESPDTSLDHIRMHADEAIAKFSGEKAARVNVHDIGFGLKELEMTFVSDEAKGDSEPLEKQILAIQGVESVEVTDVRRALG